MNDKQNICYYHHDEHWQVLLLDHPVLDVTFNTCMNYERLV